MHAYLVRTTDEKKLVGILVAETVGQLFRMVDETIDPFTCEYLSLNANEGLFISGQFEAYASRGESCARTATPPDTNIADFDTQVCVVLSTDREEPAKAPCPTERLAITLEEAEPQGWAQFTRTDFEIAFGLEPGAADDPQFVQVIEREMGLAVSRAALRS